MDNRPVLYTTDKKRVSYIVIIEGEIWIHHTT